MITAIASPDAVVELRPSPVSMALYSASLVVALAFVVLNVGTGAPPVVMAFFLVCVVAITTYNTATVLSRVRGHTDGWLEVRNRCVTRRLQRSDIDRVLLGRRSGSGSLRRLELLLDEGPTATLPFVRHRSLDRQAAELQNWQNGHR